MRIKARFEARVQQVLFIAVITIAAFCCSRLTLWAQTSGGQTSNSPASASPAANANQSWSATTDSQNADTGPTRTIESHSQSGNRILDKQAVQRRDEDGHYQPYQDIEKETIQVDVNTVRTITRTFGRDANGDKAVTQVVEEEKRSLPGGDSNVVRTTSNPDGSGNLQLIRRQIEETKKISANVEDTKTTVLLPDANGGLAPAMKVQERREQDANGTVQSQQTTLVPDGAGNWQVNEKRLTMTRKDGADRTTDQRISRPDAEGDLGEVSRTVSKEAAGVSGDKSNVVETYSVDIAGTVREGTSLHLVERGTTAQHTSASGQQSTVQRVEQTTPGDPSAGLQLTIVSTDNVSPGASGAQGTRTVQMRDANGNNGSLGTVSVDTTKSDNIHAVQVQIAPDKPK